MGLWPVRCAPVGSVAVGSVLWRFQGELRVTAIVKATFAMPETGDMTRINPQPIRRSDDYLHGLPSLAGASEIAPRLSEAGAVVIGYAYSPSPDGTKKRSIRFTIVRKNTLLIDKTLYVYGDRVKGGAPKRFTRMHVGYERALGGLDFSRNPVGVGMDKGSIGRPNIIHPGDPKRAVGGYGPIPARFPRRHKKLGAVKRSDLESSVVELPNDFDWEYFQAAPRDQRIRQLRGDEWLMLEGMHPRYPRVRVRIPKARALARIYKRKNVEAPDMVELSCDTLHIEPEQDRCSLVWRSDFTIASELAASALVIAGVVVEGPGDIAWPASVEELEHIASPAQKGKVMRGASGEPLFSTAVSPGVPGRPAGAPHAPPPPPRRHRTPPPPMPPASVPPPPAWQKVARPSWNEFPAISEDLESGAYPGSGVVSSKAVSSAMASSGPYPSYPGSAPGVEGWSREATQYQAPVDYVPPAPARPYAATPTGTIPAPPPDEPLPDPFHPLERTDEIAGGEDGPHPLETTDPLEGDDDDSEWTQTHVADEEADS